MKFLTALKNLILKLDLFSAPATLRKSGEPFNESICCGILSLLMIVFFTTIFAYSVKDMLQHKDITVETLVFQDKNSAISIDNFFMAFSIVQSRSLSYFQFNLTQKTYINQQLTETKQIELQLCYNVYWCVKNGSHFGINGLEWENNFTVVELIVSICDQTKSVSCNQSYVQDLLIFNFTWPNQVRFIIAHNQITPSSKQFITQKWYTTIFVPFKRFKGSVAYIDLIPYQIQTDSSFFPTKDIETVHTYNIEQQTVYSYQVSNRQRAKIVMKKAEQKYLIKRNYEKVDEIFSYVGGLFALSITLIAFCVASYSEYTYELYASEWAFVAKGENGKRITQQNLPFYKYPFYLMYDWLDSIGCAPKCCNRMQELHKVREQVNSQMDIRMLLNKLNYLDKVSNVLLNEHRQICLHLAGPPTIEQARQIRQVIELFDKTRQKQEERVINNQEQQMKNNIDFEQSHSQQFTRDIAMKNIISIMQPQNTEKETESERQLKLKVSKSLQMLINEKKNNVSDRIKVKIPQWIKASSKQPIQKEKPTLEMQQIENNNDQKQENQMDNKPRFHKTQSYYQ